MCKGNKHKHTKGEFKFTGKYTPTKETEEIGETKFVRKQYEEGVGKLKHASKTSLFYVHKGRD
jgi:hypothetical protein